jgi:hypothetical protein
MAFMLSEEPEVFFGGSAGGGKELPLDTPLPTLDGWTTIGNVHLGCRLFDEKGCTCNVTAIHSIDEYPETYRLIFDDGTDQLACADHRWLTFDAKELGALTRLDDAWRSARRKRRESRISGNKSAKFTASLCARNKVIKPICLEAPSGTVRTTRQIFETQRVGKRVNHAIPVAKPLQMDGREYLLDPYLLGVWLGDGTTTAGSITTADDEILEGFRDRFQDGAVQRKPGNRAAGYSFLGLRVVLKSVGVFGNKHIPQEYLRGSKDQRLALLQGLMDTDGFASTSGSVEFTTTNARLARDVHELIMTLGWKARMIESRATLYGKDCGPKWDIKWTPSEYVFRLARKRDRQKLATRRTTRFRYIVHVERSEPVPMRCISVDSPSRLYLCGTSMVPTHNSDAILMAALMFTEIPDYAAVIFRRTYPELSMPGGLLERAQDWLANTEAHWNGQTKTWRFPSGASVTFGHMEHENDKFNYKSSEFQFVGFDELTSFTETQYLYLFSRLRKNVDSFVPLRMRSASNPGDIGHEWTKKRFVHPETPDKERRFIRSSLSDNPTLDREEYVKSLGHLDTITRQQLLDGVWVDVRGNRFFPSRWPQFADIGDAYSYPLGYPRKIIKHTDVVRIIGIDISLGKKKTSDLTAFVCAGMARDGCDR